MASYTQNYQLHQWEPEDQFLRTDFNEDFKKIDTALKEAKTGPSCVTGSYIGTDEDITISLGFKPNFLIILPADRSGSYATDIMCLVGNESAMIMIPRYSITGTFQSCTFTQTGFTIARSGMTTKSITFCYTAFY